MKSRKELFHRVYFISFAVVGWLGGHPSKSGIYRAKDYLYSSAADYAGEKVILDGVIVVK